jgi:hypothetical protein
MNSAHRRTLEAVFSNPVPASLEWSRIESLLQGCGCRMTEGSGSRVRFSKGAEMFTTHRPHPGKEAKPYQVRAAREFLERVGVRP